MIMLSELQMVLYLNGYSPALLNAAYYVSLSVYLLIFASVFAAAKRNGLRSGIYALFAVSAIALINFVLKSFFGIPRPNDGGIHFIVKEDSAGFPSGHAAESFGASVIGGRSIFYMWALLISVSRMVLGLHYLSDITAGAVLGLVLGRAAVKYEKDIISALFDSKNIFNRRLKSQERSEWMFETRRKIFHGGFGIAVSAFVYFVPQDSAAGILAASVILIFAISRALKKKIKLPVIDWIIGTFERKKDIETFPLKGTLFFMLGSFISVSLYEKNIAAASIIILALGDCLSALVGKPFGRTKHAHNPEKSVEGSVAGFAAALAGAVFFVPFKIAAIGAFAGMVVESFSLELFGIELDDNLIIPVICGAVMTTVSFSV